MRIGVLLINTGTPQAPEATPVARYLRQFLMDPQVIDVPWLFRWPLVNLFIVPRRAPVSASQYKTIWGEKGSPLLVHTQDFSKALQKELGEDWEVRFAMRYGAPSIGSQLKEFKKSKVDRLVVFPLYPQFSLAATQSALDETKVWIRRLSFSCPVDYQPSFYAEEGFINAVSDVAKKPLSDAGADFVLFSFHGLPERQIKKTDVGGNHCLQSQSCCDRIGEANKNCYRAQCFHTAREVASRLGLRPEGYAVGFQSRLGRTPWIKPYSDAFYRELPKKGIRRLAVLCPSFVADCLETLEEVSVRGAKEFARHGGESVSLIPCMNASAAWVQAAAKILRRYQPRT